MRPRTDIADIEVDLLLEAARRRWDADFSMYARNFLRRRLQDYAAKGGFASVSGAIPAILEDEQEFFRFRNALTIGVTEMFRDPEYFRGFRDIVMPWISTFPFARIWCAGCSTGEEAVSLAIALSEARLQARVQIYATDIHEGALQEARSGVYPIARMKANSRNYQAYGGDRPFSDYYSVEGDSVRFDEALLKNIVWAEHDLTSDTSFLEAHFVSCRNVLIYFSKPLREKVAALIDQSLCGDGYLGLGNREVFDFPSLTGSFVDATHAARIYRKSARGNACF